MIPILFALAVLIQIPAQVEATLETTVKTDTSNVGDEVLAVLNHSVAIDDRIVVPQGARLFGRVETIRAATAGVEGWMRLVFREIELPDGRRVSTWLTNSFHAPAQKRVARHILFVGAGAAAGAFAGGKSARTTGIIGGILAGFLVATNTGRSERDLTLNAGDEIGLVLMTPSALRAVSPFAGGECFVLLEKRVRPAR